ncbi:hypothetical protein [Tumebacillus permanentifrigoris]|uniref:Uncharacterized protein n=1 Tax=Tumebacillus permanentifrigoris TaxID=378543 RepID=A0A316D6D5_9BACL|nr:hypothetical protein [Tumebacillus permanentifrigoris]PWK10233.1 hypothetical protein C7459_11254 [Tumebacillus permanentifrigoris]
MLTGWMLYTMWGVLGLIGLNWLVDMYRALVGKTFTWSTLTDVLGSMMTTVLPMLILAYLMALDPTGWIVLIAYYLAGLGLVLHNLCSLKKKMF